MRVNKPVTNNEKELTVGQCIVSTTDLKGRLSSANEHFINISGFDKDELIGQSHNLVRHPDMPPAAFNSLWSTIKSGRPWMGLVKNRCKNGDFYWVDAFVTPMISDNTTVGYQSVRLKPSKDTIKRATALYLSINKPPSFIRSLLKWRPALRGQILFSGLISILLVLIGAQFISPQTAIGSVSLAILGILAHSLLAALIAAPWRKAAVAADEVFKNTVAQEVYTGRKDELGQMQLAIQFLKAQQNTIIWRSSEAVEELGKAAQDANEVACTTESNMHSLSQEVELVASAMTEMTSTVQEVAQNASGSAAVTQETSTNVEQGQKIVNNTQTIINNLSARIDDASAIIQSLANDSERIGSVTEVINSIAEQTNLLALNAAIEAARAGDLGRGFAVVADEVRSLAGKTQSSTGEISSMISSLQSSAQAAVTAMQESKSAALDSVNHAAQTETALDVISENTNTIKDMSIQIATAAEEQSAVSEEINRNITNINNSAIDTLSGCRRVNQSNIELIDSIAKLKNMIIQFGDR